MNNLTIAILFSLIVITFVGLALIPQMIIPDFYSSVAIKKAAPKSETINIQTVPDGGCPAALYGMDCKVTGYLEQNFLKPSKGGQVFCSYEKIAEVESGAPDSSQDLVYLKYLCQEFYLSAGFIYGESGIGGPAKVTVSIDGSISHWVPRDGSDFTKDIQGAFPDNLQEAALSPVKEEISQINRERAQNVFKAQFDFKVEKTTDTACNYDFECVTPGEYLMMSRCPFTSKCINDKCAVICLNSQKIELPK